MLVPYNDLSTTDEDDAHEFENNNPVLKKRNENLHPSTTKLPSDLSVLEEKRMNDESNTDEECCNEGKELSSSKENNLIVFTKDTAKDKVVTVYISTIYHLKNKKFFMYSKKIKI